MGLGLGLAVVMTGMLAVSAARAEEPAVASSKSSSGVAASALKAVLGGEITLRLRNGQERTGVLRGLAADVITLEGEGSDALTVPRAEVVELRLVSPPPVEESALADALGDSVQLRLRDGQEHQGTLLNYTVEEITLIGADSVVHTVQRAELVEMRHRAELRKFGLNLGLPPGLMVDVDAGLFRAYFSGSVVFPAALEGKLWGFSSGLGVGIPVLPSEPRLKVDVLAHANVMGIESACSACNFPTVHVLGFGVAVGVHTTLDSGFTTGLTVPVIGYSVAPNHKGTPNAFVGHYYLSSAVSMPLLFIGYRF